MRLIDKSLVALVIFLTLIILHPLNLNASEPKDVRVGYFLIGNIQELSDDGRYSGYLYEYLREIQPFTNWRYDFVRCDWAECLNKLENNEIDLLGYVVKNSERENRFGFTNFYVGYNSTKLITNKDDLRYRFDDFNSFDKFTVGIQKESVHIEKLQEYAKINNFTYTVKLYENDDEIFRALKNKDIDAGCITLTR